jgi:hypothetical protein
VHGVDLRVVRDAARMMADVHAANLAGGDRIDRRDGARPAKHDVQEPPTILDHATRLVARRERDRRENPRRIEVDDHDVIAVGIGDRRLEALRHHEQRAPADGGGPARWCHDGLVIAAVGSAAGPETGTPRAHDSAARGERRAFALDFGDTAGQPSRKEARRDNAFHCLFQSTSGFYLVPAASSS